MRFVNWNGQYVYNLTPEDWGKLNTSNYLFARKFDITVDFKIIKYLEMKRNKVAYRKEIERKYITDDAIQ
jgi:hypothetical protein